MLLHKYTLLETINSTYKTIFFLKKSTMVRVTVSIAKVTLLLFDNAEALDIKKSWIPWVLVVKLPNCQIGVKGEEIIVQKYGKRWFKSTNQVLKEPLAHPRPTRIQHPHHLLLTPSSLPGADQAQHLSQ